MALSNHFIAIDASTTRDVDDAFSISEPTSGWVVSVIIPDLSTAVPIDSELDRRAHSTAASIYARDRVIRAMLPLSVSEKSASLLEGQPRPVFRFDLTFDRSFSVVDFAASRTQGTVSAAVSYDDAFATIREPTSANGRALKSAADLALGLLNARRAKGALALYDAREHLLSGEDGKLRRFARVEEVIGHIIVQELMIATNAAVAHWLTLKNAPIIYRNHQARTSAPTPREFAASLADALLRSDASLETTVERMALLLLPAEYSATLQGHYALCLPAYFHLTSPLRRYADLVNQRALAACLGGHRHPYDTSKLSAIATHLNTVLSEREGARDLSFKAAVTNRAFRALGARSLSNLNEAEFHQAVKLGWLERDTFAALEEEFCLRLAKGTLPNKTMLEPLLFGRGADESSRIRAALGLAIAQKPPLSISLWNEALQQNAATDFTVSSEPGGDGFHAIAKIAISGSPFSAHGKGRTKRDAEQDAAVSLWVRVSHLTLPATDAFQASRPDAAQSSKPRLLERCQALKWPLPTFATVSTGPSHAPAFTTTCTVNTGVRRFTSIGTGASKKAAESSAAASLLDQLPTQTSPAPAPIPSENAVGALQEFAQKHHLALPHYNFSEEPASAAKRFSCRCYFEIAGGERIDRVGQGATKNDAKQAAAANVLGVVTRTAETFGRSLGEAFGSTDTVVTKG